MATTRAWKLSGARPGRSGERGKVIGWAYDTDPVPSGERATPDTPIVDRSMAPDEERQTARRAILGSATIEVNGTITTLAPTILPEIDTLLDALERPDPRH
ncbi:hypothetical protein GCM10009691_40070 [Brevibacterium picturae]|uniref:Transposase n=2 Tax=Brevibacterium picturae TaxID=260553 RepID=A0ABN2CT19_9MICO